MTNEATSRISFQRETLDMNVDEAVLSDNIVTDPTVLSFLQLIAEDSRLQIEINRQESKLFDQLVVNTSLRFDDVAIGGSNEITHANLLAFMRLVEGTCRLNLRIEIHNNLLL